MIEIEILLTFVYFLECTVIQCKDTLSIYWNRHGHECSRIWKLFVNFTLIQCIKIVLWDQVPTMVEIAIFWFQIHITNGLNFMHRKWYTGSSSRSLRTRFSADLTMYWFPVYHFRCMKFKPLVIWNWNQNMFAGS
jgi:hypothetical protein